MVKVQTRIKYPFFNAKWYEIWNKRTCHKLIDCISRTNLFTSNFKCTLKPYVPPIFLMKCLHKLSNALISECYHGRNKDTYNIIWNSYLYLHYIYELSTHNPIQVPQKTKFERTSYKTWHTFKANIVPVSYTHLTLPTNREV